MDAIPGFADLVRSRLAVQGSEQKELARAARVTESYISQLLTRKKPPPAPRRTDIYGRMEAFLGLAAGELGRVAEIERAEQIKRRLGRTQPLFEQFRGLVLRKCIANEREAVRAIFEARPFGTLERLVAQKMLDVVQRIARRELDNEDWMRLAARVGGQSVEALRVMVLEFLDSDIFDVSKESCVVFLDPLVDSWNVDLESLRLDILLNPTLVAKPRCTFAFVEGEPPGETPGLAAFLEDRKFSDGVTEEEIAWLQRQSFGTRRPNKMYYYRALQNLRDPLHFEDGGTPS